MVRAPHDFFHVKELDGGENLELLEEGKNNLSINYPVKFQKFFAKEQAEMYIGYDHGVDMKNDEFIDGLRYEEKEQFRKEMVSIWSKNRGKYDCKNDMWYMVLQGTKANGESCVKLFQDKKVFKKERDEEFTNPAKGNWSKKGCWFHNLEDAKNYIQMCRDEEGDLWKWPQQIPVIWKKGPLTVSDLDTLGHALGEEEKEEL